MVGELWFDIFIVATAATHALLEIQIEGKHGWAEKLPTKRFDNQYTKAIWGVPITAYHVVLMLFIFLIAHFPVLFVSWSAGVEFIIIGFIVLHFTLEDFFWFVFNPHYGLHKFKKENIWWHKRWIGPLPAAYWWSFPLGTILLTLGFALSS